MNTIKKVSLILIAALLLSLLSACGGNSGSNTDGDTSNNSSHGADDPSDPGDGGSSAEVTRILVGTSGSPKPFLFTDDDNNVVGFDADVVAAVDELLPEYEFEYELTDFAAVFTGIDAGIYQMGDNNITKKPEREEKYLFGEEYYGYNYTGLVVKADNDSITSLEDLAGLTTYTSGNGGFGQLFFEAYNEEHADDPVELVYTSADQRKQFQDLQDGVIDFTFMESVMWDNYKEEFPEFADTLKFVFLSDEETSEIQDPLSWFIFPKTDEGKALQEAVDGALRELKENGRLNEIGQQWLGYDVVR